ncbi:glycyl-radical enzyme activating protein [Poriferisphaera sp. WC338]|uniref:glycyl-radical enzyme activating protein n=1 Tax=Poriferisphaera sp. WC338 TaxID=3425129 RepID=UPI003D81882C
MITQHTGMVFDVQRTSLLDGPGLRTTVFLKGCPLRCAWCHNPESQQRKPELSFRADRCTGCRTCESSCSRDVHLFVMNGRHELDRSKCNGCNACVQSCPSEALKLYGQTRSINGIMDIVKRDIPYYNQSGGGLTISGGEPLTQIDFAVALLQAAQDQGIHTCVETCGHVSLRNIQRVQQVTDLFLYDVKAIDSELHRKLTQVGNERILSNLRYLHDSGADIILRCPIIPGQNDAPYMLRQLVELIRSLPKIRSVEIMPYHDTGRDKYERLGRTCDPMPSTVPREQGMQWVNTLKQLDLGVPVTLSN